MLIDDVMSGVANIVCGVPRGSVLGPLKLCLYLLPLGAILKYHGIGYHIYADDTQPYYCNSVLYTLPKSSILRLQIIQNQTVCILTRTPRRDHTTEVLIDLHWLKNKERIVYKILIFTFRRLLIVLPHCICVN